MKSGAHSKIKTIRRKK